MLKKQLLLLMAMMVSYFSMISQSYGFRYNTEERGKPFIKNYTPKDYNAHLQNWAVVQDHRGNYYFGNNDGLLEYDGENWSLLTMPNYSVVRSLDIDNKTGRVYVGASDEIGYITHSETGKLQYVSLVEKLNIGEVKFQDVWRTYVTDQGVYFQTDYYLFRINGDDVKIWPSEQGLRNHISHYTNGIFFLNNLNIGLKYMVNDTLKFIPNGEFFKGKRIYAILPYDSKKVIIVTRNFGLFIYDTTEKNPDKAVKPYKTKIDKFLISSQIYHALKLSDGNYAFGTRNNGVLILNPEGKLIQRVDEKFGLQINDVLYLYEDNSQGLVLGLNKGIARAEVISSFSIWDDDNGISGTIDGLLRYKDVMYTVSQKGVFYLKDNNFHQIENIAEQSWSLLNFPNPEIKGKTHLLAGTSNGVYEIVDFKPKRLRWVRGDAVFGMFISRFVPSRIYLALDNGIVSLRYKNGKWTDEGHIENFNVNTRSILEDEKGNLWVGTYFNGVYKFTLSDVENRIVEKIDLFNEKHNLVTKRNRVFKLHDTLVFSSKEGLFYFDNEAKEFKLYPIDKAKKQYLTQEIYSLWVDKNEAIWVVGNNSGVSPIVQYVLQEDGSYKANNKPFNRFPSALGTRIYEDANGVMWFGNSEGLFRYSKDSEKRYKLLSKVQIRKITIGRNSKVLENINFDNSEETIIGYDENTLRFQYSLPYFDDEENNSYSCYMEGIKDDHWSEWSMVAQKDYANLREGNYTFHLKARNVYGVETEELKFSFTVSPPYYRTMLAYLIYAVIAVVLIVGLVKLNTHRLKVSNARLEAIVLERTHEIQQQKEELVAKSENLKLVNKEIQAKNDAITVQNEELAQQKEEIASQSENLRKANIEIAAQRDNIEAQKNVLEEAQKTISLKNDLLKSANSNLESKVEKRTAEVNEAYRELDHFIYKAAHDLKGPITRLLGLCYLGKREKDHDATENYFYMLEDTSKDMGNMLTRLLSVHHMKTKQLNIDKFNLKETFDDIIGLFKADHKDLKITLDYHLENDFNFNSDKVFFSTLIKNFLQNCADFKDPTKPFCETNIAVNSNNNKNIIITIKDNGQGIIEDVHEKLFEMFEIGNENSKGIGLGLYEAKVISRKLKGKVSLKNTSDEGSIFEIELPIYSFNNQMI